MIRVTVLYENRGDTEAFDAYYFETHVPLARTIPGLERFEAVVCGPGPDGAAPAYHLIAGLYFVDGGSLQAGLGSPEGQAVTADTNNFPGDWTSTVLIGEVLAS